MKISNTIGLYIPNLLINCQLFILLWQFTLMLIIFLGANIKMYYLTEQIFPFSFCVCCRSFISVCRIQHTHIPLLLYIPTTAEEKLFNVYKIRSFRLRWCVRLDYYFPCRPVYTSHNHHNQKWSLSNVSSTVTHNCVTLFSWFHRIHTVPFHQQNVKWF